MSRTIEYKSKFFIYYFVDPPLALITFKFWQGILSTSFFSLTKVIFPKIAFLSSEIAECCRPPT